MLSRVREAGFQLLKRTSVVQHASVRHSCVRLFSADNGDDEEARFDCCIVGAGPAGLSAAIKLKQLSAENGKEISVCVLEKAKSTGGHSVSGAVLETTALEDLFPEWKEDPTCPVSKCPVTKNRMYFMFHGLSIPLVKPPFMKSSGKEYVISLSQMIAWLGQKAESLGVDVFPGFPVETVTYNSRGTVDGVMTRAMGLDRDGEEKPSFIPGMRISAKVTLLAEGCRGSVSEEIMKKYLLREKEGCDPQTYALGVKEVWKIDPAKHMPGTVWHTVGYPLPWNVYGGGWVYHMADGLVSLGLVTALDYSNPTLSPYGEFQKFKKHPRISALLEGGECIQYGARSLNEGGLQALPQLHFPGGAIIGDAAGFLNVGKIKGIHTAMKSGMIAAEHVFKGLEHVSSTDTLPDGIDMRPYDEAVRKSWIHDELYKSRNIRPGFSQFGGLPGGLMHAAVDSFLLRGGAPWTLHMRRRRRDHEHLVPIDQVTPIEYPKPDGKVTFSVAESLYRSGTNHTEDQPSHLKLINPKLPDVVNLPIYGGPEQHYCPANVYEYIDSTDAQGKRLQKLHINATNCLHCKACDIKDPHQNIKWTVPEGGDGPKYTCT